MRQTEENSVCGEKRVHIWQTNLGIRRLFSIFVGEVSWCNWTVRTGEKCVWVGWCGRRDLNRRR
jgi:hypothetical protein